MKMETTNWFVYREEKFWTFVESHKKENISKLVLCVGTNHIPEESPDLVANNLLSLINEIRTHMPDTKLLVSSILPKINKNFLRGIDYINYVLSQQSKTLGFRLINNSQFCTDGQFDNTLFSNDMLHLSRKGVIQLGRNIKYNFFRV